MNGIIKTITWVFVLCMIFPMITFAKEQEISKTELKNVQEYYDNKINVSESVFSETAIPAASNQLDIYVDDSTGHVYITFYAIKLCSIKTFVDETSVDLIYSAPITSSYDIPVPNPNETWIYIFDCGILANGSHYFQFSGRRCTFPYSTISFNTPFMIE